MKNSPLKTPAPADSEILDNPEGTDSIERIVEDLGQQDVLPIDGGSVDPPSETLNGGLDETGRWDEPIGTSGIRAERVPLEDETSSLVELVDEGLDEADEELRDLDELEEEELEAEDEL